MISDEEARRLLILVFLAPLLAVCVSLRPSLGDAPKPIGEIAPTKSMTETERYVLGLPIDLNRAQTSDLEIVDGIGPKLAARIVHERERTGAYVSVEDLDRVPGIGPKTIERLTREVHVETTTITPSISREPSARKSKAKRRVR